MNLPLILNQRSDGDHATKSRTGDSGFARAAFRSLTPREAMRRTSGAPWSRANGAYRHGLYTAKAAEERRRLRELLDQVRETMAGIS